MSLAIIAISLIFIVFSNVAVASSEKAGLEKSIRELIEVTHVNKQLDNVIKIQKKTLMQQMIAQYGKRIEASEEEVKLVAALTSELMDNVMAQVDFENIALNIYSKVFTQDEIESLIAFYKTDLGQKILNKSPQLIQELYGQMIPKMQNIMTVEGPKFEKKLELELAKLNKK